MKVAASLKIAGFGGIVFLVKEIKNLKERITTLSDNVDSNTNHINNVIRDVLELKHRLDALNLVIGNNLAEFQQNLIDLDMALDDIDVLKILADLQSAKVEALEAIRLAEGAYAFFNGPIELADYIQIENGVVRYRTDYKIENEAIILKLPTSVPNSNIGVSSSFIYYPHSTENQILSRTVTGFKPVEYKAPIGGINLVIDAERLIIPSTDRNRRYIIRFKNSQSFQGLNAFTLPCIDGVCGNRFNVRIKRKQSSGLNDGEWRWVEENRSSTNFTNTTGRFRIRTLTPEYLEIFVTPKDPDIHTSIGINAVSDPVLVIPLNNCVVNGIFTYIEGSEASGSENGDILL